MNFMDQIFLFWSFSFLFSNGFQPKFTREVVAVLVAFFTRLEGGKPVLSIGLA